MVRTRAAEATINAAKIKVLRHLSSRMHAWTIGEIAMDLGLTKATARGAVCTLIEEGKLQQLLHSQLPKGLQGTPGRVDTSICYVTPENVQRCARYDRQWDEQARTEDLHLAAELAAHRALKELFALRWEAEYEAELARLTARNVAEPYHPDGIEDGRWCVVRVNGHARNILRPLDPASLQEDQVYGTKEEAMRGARHWNEVTAHDTGSESC